MHKTRSCLYLQLPLIYNYPFGSPRERFIYYSIHEQASKVIYNANPKFNISGTFYSCPHFWVTLISTLLTMVTLFGSVRVLREDQPLRSTTEPSITPSPWHVKVKAASHASLSSPATLLLKERQHDFSPTHAFIYENNIWNFIGTPHRTRNATSFAAFSNHLLFFKFKWNFQTVKIPVAALGMHFPLTLADYRVASGYFKLSWKQSNSRTSFTKSRNRIIDL